MTPEIIQAIGEHIVVPICIAAAVWFFTKV